MTNKNIQMKKREGNGWDNLFPLTTEENVFNNQGEPLNQSLDTLKNKTNTLENDLETTKTNVTNLESNLTTRIDENRTDIDNLPPQLRTIKIFNMKPTVEQLLEGEVGLVVEPVDHNIVYYPFNETSGDYIGDHSNNLKHLRAVGTTINETKRTFNGTSDYAYTEPFNVVAHENFRVTVNFELTDVESSSWQTIVSSYRDLNGKANGFYINYRYLNSEDYGFTLRFNNEETNVFVRLYHKPVANTRYRIVLENTINGIKGTLENRATGQLVATDVGSDTPMVFNKDTLNDIYVGNSKGTTQFFGGIIHSMRLEKGVF